jgi:hypothetical protein
MRSSSRIIFHSLNVDLFFVALTLFPCRRLLILSNADCEKLLSRDDVTFNEIYYKILG